MKKHPVAAEYVTYPLIPLVLTAESEAEFKQKQEALEKWLAGNGSIRERFIQLTAYNPAHCYRGIVVYNEITKQASLAFKNNISPEICTPRERPVIFMFTGIGNQYLNMARGLYDNSPLFREYFDYCCNFLEPLLQGNMKEIIFPPAGRIDESLLGESGSRQRFDLKRILDPSRLKPAEPRLLDKTEYLHPLLFIVEYSLARLLLQWGIVPAALIGHSVGEYVAATISGILSIDDALTLITKRAQLIEKLPPGVMLTVLAGKEELEPMVKAKGKLFLAAENSPISCTVSGEEDDICKLEAELAERDVVFLRLSTDKAFHSPFMEPVEREFKQLFDMVKVKEFNIPLVSNLTGNWATNEQMGERNNWFLHTCKTVQFSEGIQKLLDLKNCVLIEIGPGQTLTGFVYQHKFKGKNPNALILSMLRNANDNSTDQDFLFNELCKLWVHGIDINWKEVLSFPAEAAGQATL